MYGISNACPLPSQVIQEKMFWRSFAQLNRDYQYATWMCGLDGNNVNPLTKDEVMQLANSKTPFSWAYRDINRHLDKRPFKPLSLEIH